MKQLYIQTATQHPKSIEDEFSVKNQSNIGRNSNRLAILNPKQPKGAFGTDNREWQGTGLCKGPPGRPRSPGSLRGHPPARLCWPDGPDARTDPPASPLSLEREGQGVSQNKFQTFKNIKFKFYSQSNFTIMKKQILILMFLALAIFAGVNRSYGQAVAGSAPRGVSCTNDPVHPVAGKPYTYKAASGQAGNYTFWATTDVDFIKLVTGVPTNNMSTMLTVGTQLLNATNYATAGATDNTIITWSDATLNAAKTTPTFVVVNKDGICADNLKVWKLDPITAFTVDIKNIDHSNVATSNLAYDAAESQCMDKVQSAKYNAGTVEYDFGKQILYFEVIAANFSVEYTPTFTIAGLGSGQTAVIEWAYDRAFTSPVTVTSGVASGTKVATSATDTSTGVSIYVRVTITNTTFEGIAATPISLDVDAQNSVGTWDIDNGNGSTCNATTGADHLDLATQTLNPRPDVTPVAPSTPFNPTNVTN